MKHIKPKNISDWIIGKEYLINLGFTEKEIIKAIRNAKLTMNNLTSKEPESRAWSKIKIPIGLKSNFFTDIIVHKGHQYERHYTKITETFIVPDKYQHLKHGKITKELLKNRFPWFVEFKWSIYSIEEKYEIYMKTEFGSLYVPIKALLEKNKQIIIDRMTSYYQEYRLTSSYPLNKHINETKEEFEKRKKEEYKKDISPLKSKEAKKLFGYLK